MAVYMALQFETRLSRPDALGLDGGTIVVEIVLPGGIAIQSCRVAWGSRHIRLASGHLRCKSTLALD